MEGDGPSGGDKRAALVLGMSRTWSGGRIHRAASFECWGRGWAMIRTVIVWPSASFICEAMVRIQISSYSRNWSPVSLVWAGVWNVSPAGRIASCASWAFLTLRGVDPRLVGQVVGAEQLPDLIARGGDRRLRQRHRVGSHVGDEAGLVEVLRDRHRALRGETELAAGLLLQGRGAERRVRAAACTAWTRSRRRESGVARGRQRLRLGSGRADGASRPLIDQPSRGCRSRDPARPGARRPGSAGPGRAAARRRRRRRGPHRDPSTTRTGRRSARARDQRPAGSPPTGRGRPTAAA